MSTSNQNTPTVDAEYPTIYVSASGYPDIVDAQILSLTAKRIVVIVPFYNEAEQYWPTYTLNRADLEAGKPCSRKFILRIPKHRARKGEPLEITTSRYVIEFSFCEVEAFAASRTGHDFEKAFRMISECEFALARNYLIDLYVLGTPIPADHELREYVKILAWILDRIPVLEEIPKGD